MSDEAHEDALIGANIMARPVGATFHEKGRREPFLTLHPNFATADEALSFAERLVKSSDVLSGMTHQILVTYQNPALLIRTYKRRPR